MDLDKQKLERMLDYNYLIVDWHPTGSNYICDPPVNNTDIDYVCKLTDQYLFPSFIITSNWKLCQHEGAIKPKFTRKKEGVVFRNAAKFYAKDVGPKKFYAFRKDNYNLIFVKNNYWYERWVRATEIAKERNLLIKKDRVSLFADVFTNWEKYKLVKQLEWI